MPPSIWGRIFHAVRCYCGGVKWIRPRVKVSDSAVERVLEVRLFEATSFLQHSVETRRIQVVKTEVLAELVGPKSLSECTLRLVDLHWLEYTVAVGIKAAGQVVLSLSDLAVTI
jgi:hypothetical protein